MHPIFGYRRVTYECSIIVELTQMLVEFEPMTHEHACRCCHFLSGNAAATHTLTVAHVANQLYQLQMTGSPCSVGL